MSQSALFLVGAILEFGSRLLINTWNLGTDGAGSRITEHDDGSPAEQPVEATDERHHDDNEDQHDQRVTDQLFSCRRDDFLKFCEDLLNEKHDSRKRVAPGIPVALGAFDDSLTGFVDYLSCPR
jgi:hypothetical protein